MTDKRYADIYDEAFEDALSCITDTGERGKCPECGSTGPLTSLETCRSCAIEGAHIHAASEARADEGQRLAGCF